TALSTTASSADMRAPPGEGVQATLRRTGRRRQEVGRTWFQFMPGEVGNIGKRKCRDTRCRGISSVDRSKIASMRQGKNQTPLVPKTGSEGLFLPRCRGDTRLHVHRKPLRYKSRAGSDGTPVAIPS